MQRISSEEALLDAAELNPSTAPFAWFYIDASQMRHVDGPHKGELMFPELEGKETPLWNITSNSGSEADQKRGEADVAKAAHRQRVLDMTSRVANGLGALTDSEADDPTDEGEALDPAEDEWTRFWGGESPTEKLAHVMAD